MAILSPYPPEAKVSLADNLEPIGRKVADGLISQKAYLDFDAHYAKYTQLYDELAVHYRKYAEGSQKYNDAIDSIARREQTYWQQIEQEIHSGWGKYQQQQDAHIAKASARAQQFGPKIVDYYEGKNKCLKRYDKPREKDRRQHCLEYRAAEYRNQILKAGLGYIEPNYWLIAEEVSFAENAMGSVVMGVLTGGLSTALQAGSLLIGGDGGFTDKLYKYTEDPDHYQRRFLLHPKFQQMFFEDTGYPFAIGGLAAFRNHPTTQRKLRDHMSKKGLNLNANWTIIQRDLFSRAVADKVKREAQQKWSKEISKQGLTLKPNLSWVEFQLHPEIQQRIAAQMGDNYVRNIRADWNQKNFKSKVIEPNIAKRTEQYMAMLNGEAAVFADGGKYEEYGKQALRSVIVPTVSMVLSLFLICTTLFKLPFSVWGVYRSSHLSDFEQETTWLKVINVLFVLAFVLFTPPLFVESKYTQDDNSPVSHFLKKMAESTSPVISYFVRWSLHAQPLLLPVGQLAEESFGVYQAFQPFSHALAEVDILKKPTHGLVQARSERAEQMPKQSVSLTVVTKPKNARVRIMNIGPKYRPHIPLNAGAYDIEVSAPGYKTYRKWHRLTAGERLVLVELSEQ